MRNSLAIFTRATLTGNKLRKGLPKIPLMAPPHEVDISKYTTLFEEYKTIPHVWKAKNLKDAWAAIYKELGASLESKTEADKAQMRLYDIAGLSRLSSNLEISRILLLMPERIREGISKHPSFKLGQLEEIFIHVGMPVEIRGDGWTFTLEEESSAPQSSSEISSSAIPSDAGDHLVTSGSGTHQSLVATSAEISYIENRIAPFGTDGRSTLPGTLHRISAYRGKNGQDLVGFTIRAGKYIANAGRALASVLEQGNLLILSRPSVGKTTLLRDLAVQASLQPGHPRVLVIDTSCEIAGDNITPLPFMNRVRRILVRERKLQGEAMLDALQNHSPDYIIVDEIANAQEAEAAYTIAQRGVKLIATCHAENLTTLLSNNQLSKLVGGVAQAFLSNEERRLRGKTKKSVLERPSSSPFKFVLEVPSRARGVLYTDVNTAVDKILEEGYPKDLSRSMFDIKLDEELPPAIDRVVRSVNTQNTPTMQEQRHFGNNNNNNNKSHRSNRIVIEEADDGFAEEDGEMDSIPAQKNMSSMLPSTSQLYKRR